MAICSNSVPGCSQEPFSRRRENLQRGCREAGWAKTCFWLQPGMPVAEEGRVTRRLQGGRKEAARIELYKSGARLASS